MCHIRHHTVWSGVGVSRGSVAAPHPTLRLLRPVAKQCRSSDILVHVLQTVGCHFPQGRGERLPHLALNTQLSLANLLQRPWVIPALAWPVWTSCGPLKRLEAASGFSARRRGFPFPSTGMSSPAVCHLLKENAHGASFLSWRPLDSPPCLSYTAQPSAPQPLSPSPPPSLSLACLSPLLCTATLAAATRCIWRSLVLSSKGDTSTYSLHVIRASA